jgi:short-subunit dehydrogenase
MIIRTGTRALITGASRGIGRSLAVALAGRGATLGLAARSTDELHELARALPGEHHVLRCDVADEDSVREAVAAFVAATGGLDLVIANAGLTHYGPFRDQTMDQLRQMTDVNWYGTLFTVHAALPTLLQQAPARPGHVVIMSSGAGLRSFPSAAVYGATKAAQRMFGEALRHELGGTGVGLTVVYPGEIATSLHHHEQDRMPAWYRGGPKAARPEALAAKVIAAIEKDARAVYYPPLIRVLGGLHGLSPQLSDRFLRRLRGAEAAPRVD